MDKHCFSNKKLKHKLNVCTFPNTFMSVYEDVPHGETQRVGGQQDPGQECREGNLFFGVELFFIMGICSLNYILE